MRRRINLLPWPYRFLHSIYKHIIVPGYGFLLLAETEGEIASGGLFLEYKNTSINKINASDARYIHLRSNYLLMWKAIEYAYSRSCHHFDFGITNPENMGLLKFKNHWHSQQTTLPYYYYPEVRGTSAKPETSLMYRAHTSINRMLPNFVLKLAAEALYRRMG
jgi:lipid II:glycine glycyltransferase (peptidoglycan interpeptide bridge formation enzyme)